MEKISLKKQLLVVRLYLSGLSYSQISAKAGVAKGTVSNIVAELKAGQILEVHEAAEQIELLRALAIDLGNLKLTPGQALAGVAMISRLKDMGLEPEDIQRWAAMCQHAEAEKVEIKVFIRAALALEEVREHTGLGIEALEEKAHELEEKVAKLKPLAQKLKKCQGELDALQTGRQSLLEELSQREKQLNPLRQEVVQKEKREVELSSRVQDLEQKAHVAEERLAVARKELKVLAELGLSPDDLSGLVQRLSGVAQRHGIKSAALRERLLHELEQLEAGLGLEALVEMKQAQLNQISLGIKEDQRKLQALEAATKGLKQQRAAIHKLITEERKGIRKKIRAIAKTVEEAAAGLKQDLGVSLGEALAEVQQLRNQAVEMGRELGHLEDAVEANRWLQALVALTKGGDGVSAGDAKAIGLSLLRGLQTWLAQRPDQFSSQPLLQMQVSSMIEDLERWKA